MDTKAQNGEKELKRQRCASLNTLGDRCIALFVTTSEPEVSESKCDEKKHLMHRRSVSQSTRFPPINPKHIDKKGNVQTMMNQTKGDSSNHLANHD